MVEYSYAYLLFLLFAGMVGLIAAAKVVSGNTLNNDFHHKLATPVILRAVELVYFQDFPLKKKQNNSAVSGCFYTLGALPVFGLSITPVLRCKEYIYLLRPEVTIEYLKKLQKKNGFVDLNLSEFGINHIEAKVVSVKSVSFWISTLRAGKKDINAVTGVFKRHSMDVGQYQFKTEGIKSVRTLNVTNNHRFYVENKQEFIPIKTVQSTDYLLTDTGRQVRLLCSYNRQEECGKPYHPEKPVQVYNIEIDQRHTYFVGHDSILAHNPCGKNIRYAKRYYDREGKIPRFKGYINKYTFLYHEGTEYAEQGHRIYRGSWKNGRYHGQGIEYNREGYKIYEGSWENGKYHGIGTKFKQKNRKEYYGPYVNGLREGKGTLFYFTGEKSFYGMFEDGARRGYGIQYHRNSKIMYEGEWFASYYHGFGSSYDENGVLEYSGIWDKGKYQGAEVLAHSEENGIKKDPWPDPNTLDLLDLL